MLHRHLSRQRLSSRVRRASAQESRTISLLSPAIGTTNAGDHFIEEAVRRLFSPTTQFESYSTRRELGRREIARMNETDAVVVCGTNLYQADWTAPAISKQSLRRIRVRVVPIGVGSSSADAESLAVPPTVADLIRRLHASCELASARDPTTMEFLAGLGIANVRLTGCPVLHWPGDDYLPPVTPGERRKVRIAPRNWLMHHDDPVDHPSTISLMETVIGGLEAVDLTYVAHEKVDVSLFRRLGLPESTFLWPSNTNEYVELYTDPAVVVLACRLHGGMMALANGVPAVFVGHDTRTYSFCEMLGLPYVKQLGADAPEKTLQSLRALLSGDLADVDVNPGRFSVLKEGMQSVLAANDLSER